MSVREYAAVGRHLGKRDLYRQLNVYADDKPGKPGFALWPERSEAGPEDRIVLYPIVGDYSPLYKVKSLRATEVLVAAWHAGEPILPILDRLYDLNPEHREALTEVLRLAREEA
jgi:hypothetical protein